MVYKWVKTGELVGGSSQGKDDMINNNDAMEEVLSQPLSVPVSFLSHAPFLIAPISLPLPRFPSNRNNDAIAEIISLKLCRLFLYLYHLFPTLLVAIASHTLANKEV